MFLLLRHYCNFDTVVNHNVSNFGEGVIRDPKVEKHCFCWQLWTPNSRIKMVSEIEFPSFIQKSLNHLIAFSIGIHSKGIQRTQFSLSLFLINQEHCPTWRRSIFQRGSHAPSSGRDTSERDRFLQRSWSGARWKQIFPFYFNSCKASLFFLLKISYPHKTIR